MFSNPGSLCLHLLPSPQLFHTNCSCIVIYFPAPILIFCPYSQEPAPEIMSLVLGDLPEQEEADDPEYTPDLGENSNCLFYWRDKSSINPHIRLLMFERSKKAVSSLRELALVIAPFSYFLCWPLETRHSEDEDSYMMSETSEAGTPRTNASLRNII